VVDAVAAARLGMVGRNRDGPLAADMAASSFEGLGPKLVGVLVLGVHELSVSA